MSPRVWNSPFPLPPSICRYLPPAHARPCDMCWLWYVYTRPFSSLHLGPLVCLHLSPLYVYTRPFSMSTPRPFGMYPPRRCGICTPRPFAMSTPVGCCPAHQHQTMGKYEKLRDNTESCNIVWDSTPPHDYKHHHLSSHHCTRMPTP